MENIPITVAYGDGIGPEIMEATLDILREAGAEISIRTIEVGEQLYLKGNSTGIPESAWQHIYDTKILLKSPITTPQGGGYKSLNVTMRKRLGLYANVRPCVSYHPFVETMHPDMDMVIIRENEEDIYAGIEYRQTHNVYQSLKMISRAGSEKIIRYAFEYAVKNGRKKVTCMSKDNIMKFSDGIFHKVFDEISKEYPSIQVEHYIIDIGTARIANNPKIFDVIVTSNLYGDVISDVAAEISGSVGLAGSANIGPACAMFEAIHGSAPDIAGKNIANPSGLINASVMMLVHIGQGDVASKIKNAWLKTLEDGCHTGDIYDEKFSKKKCGTKEFSKEVIARLGQVPSSFKKADFKSEKSTNKPLEIKISTKEVKQLVGVDVSFNWLGTDSNILAEKIEESIKNSKFGVKVISSTGLKVWPKEKGQPDVLSDQWSVRFAPKNPDKITNHNEVVELLSMLAEAKMDFIKIDNLYSFDGKLGFSLAQGE